MSQDDTGPVMVIVAGPNGSGKSTTTAQFSKDGYEVIDPDRIARNLSPGSVALFACRIESHKITHTCI